MYKENVGKMRGRVKTLQRQLAALGPCMRGSVVRIGTKNKQYYFSLNKDKKTRLIYLGDKRVEQARGFSENYKKLVKIIEEMTMLNMEILKKSKN